LAAHPDVLAFQRVIEDTLWTTHPEVMVFLRFIEVTHWPTIRCDFFLRFRSKKTPPLSASVMFMA